MTDQMRSAGRSILGAAGGSKSDKLCGLRHTRHKFVTYEKSMEDGERSAEEGSVEVRRSGTL